MSYLKEPIFVPCEGLQNQLGADYTRPRDFRRKVSKHLETVLRIYPVLSESRIVLQPLLKA